MKRDGKKLKFEEFLEDYNRYFDVKIPYEIDIQEKIISYFLW